jgi:hypothetical protein
MNIRRTLWWLILVVLCAALVFSAVFAWIFYRGVQEKTVVLLEAADYNTGAWHSGDTLGEQGPWAFCNALWHCNGFLGVYLSYALLSLSALLIYLGGTVAYLSRKARNVEPVAQGTARTLAAPERIVPPN